jgi:hypothetical protein
VQESQGRQDQLGAGGEEVLLCVRERAVHRHQGNSGDGQLGTDVGMQLVAMVFEGKAHEDEEEEKEDEKREPVVAKKEEAGRMKQHKKSLSGCELSKLEIFPE